MSLLKRYLDRYKIDYKRDFEFGVNCFYVDLNGLSGRQVRLLSWYMGRDGFKIVARGFDRIYFDVSDGADFGLK